MNHKDTAAGNEQCSDKSDKERFQAYFFKGFKNCVQPDPGEAQKDQKSSCSVESVDSFWGKISLGIQSC